jgi:hypothetical protein
MKNRFILDVYIWKFLNRIYNESHHIKGTRFDNVLFYHDHLGYFWGFYLVGFNIALTNTVTYKLY